VFFVNKWKFEIFINKNLIYFKVVVFTLLLLFQYIKNFVY
jgi:hypothetical protein